MKTNIYLPIEIKRRELNARIYFAVIAAVNGHKVTLGRKNRFSEFFNKIPPGNFITKSIGPSNFKLIRELKKLGHKIFFLDEEGLMCFNKEFTHRRITREGLELLDYFFTWGKNHFSDINTLFPDFKKKFLVTGNPRFDIIKSRAKKFYSNEVENIKKNYGNFFLLTTKFAKINYVKRKSVESWFNSQLKKGLLRSEETIQLCKKSIKHEEKNLKNFFDFIRLFNKSAKDKKLIILVHPGEEVSVYENLVRGMSNVSLASSFSTNSWILASDLIIQNNCTTSIEAYMMGVQPIQLNVFKDPDIEFKIPKIVSNIFDDNQKLINFLLNFRKEDFQKKQIYQNNILEIKNYIENALDKNSVSLILDTLFHDEFFCKDYNISSPTLEKILYKLKMFKRSTLNYIKDPGSMTLSKQKFQSLTFNEIDNFVKKILETENYQQDKFKLKEYLPGLFTLEHDKKA